MIHRLVLALSALALLLAPLAGCESKAAEEKCGKTLDKVLKMSIEASTSMIKAFAKDKNDPKIEEKIAEGIKTLEKAVAEQRADIVGRCKAKLKEDPSLEARLDCVIAAKDVAAVQACEGAREIAKLMEPTPPKGMAPPPPGQAAPPAKAPAPPADERPAGGAP